MMTILKKSNKKKYAHDQLIPIVASKTNFLTLYEPDVASKDNIMDNNIDDQFHSDLFISDFSTFKAETIKFTLYDR